MPVFNTRISTSLMPISGVAISSSHRPGPRELFTRAFISAALLPAYRGQEALVRAAEFLQNLQPAVIVQQPAKGLRRIRVLEIHPNALAPLQLALFARHRRRKIP